MERLFQPGSPLPSGNVPMVYEPGAYHELTPEEAAHARGVTTFVGQIGKEYKKTPDGVFQIDPRDVSAAIRHGFTFAGNANKVIAAEVKGK